MDFKTVTLSELSHTEIDKYIIPPIGEWQPTPVLCLENPTVEEPGRLQSMGSLRVGHD